MLTMVKPSSELYTIPDGRRLCLCVLQFLFDLCMAVVKAYLNNTRWLALVLGLLIHVSYQLIVFALNADNGEAFKALCIRYPMVGIGAWFVNSCKFSIDRFCAQC